MARIFLSSNVRNEAKLKRAAGFKVNRLVRNALDIHNTVEENDVGSSDVANSSTASVSGSGYGKALLNFAKLSDKTVMDGGLCWAWRNIWNGQLYEKEGGCFVSLYQMEQCKPLPIDMHHVCCLNNVPIPGIWLSTRIIAGNFGQIVICLVSLSKTIAFCQHSL